MWKSSVSLFSFFSIHRYDFFSGNINQPFFSHLDLNIKTGKVEESTGSFKVVFLQVLSKFYLRYILLFHADRCQFLIIPRGSTSIFLFPDFNPEHSHFRHRFFTDHRKIISQGGGPSSPSGAGIFPTGRSNSKISFRR